MILRLATYNVEWFDALFARNGKPLPDHHWSARHNITRERQLEALRTVFATIDADAVMVIEAPDTSSRRDTRRALEQFADWAGIRANTVEIGYVNETQQEIALLYDPLVLRARHDPQGAPADLGPSDEPPAFNSVYRIDLDVDAAPEPVSFSKPPLELAMEVRATGQAFRMIGVHVKSKAPHGARNRDDVIRISIENRRKQLAQCIWLRARVARHLAAGEPLVVLGDFNDGPGLDEFEALFGRSSVEIVMGRDDPRVTPDAQLFDPFADALLSGADTPSTARFYIDKERRWLDAMLDYVMVSPDLVSRAAWRIWHPDTDAEAAARPDLARALLTASDHFPVSVDIDFGARG